MAFDVRFKNRLHRKKTRVLRLTIAQITTFFDSRNYKSGMNDVISPFSSRS